MSRRLSSTLVAVALAACAESDPAVHTYTCYEPVSDALELDAASALGFSAAEAIAAIPTEATVPVTDVEGTTVERSFSFSFTPSGAAVVVARAEGTDAAPACAAALPGETLRVEGLLSVHSEAWVDATVPVHLYAKDTDPAGLWLAGSTWDVDATDALRSEALAVGAVHGTCDEDVLAFGLALGVVPERPLTVGPTGGALVRFEGCGRGMTAPAASWGEAYDPLMFVDPSDP